MFVLDGKPLALDRAFTVTSGAAAGNQYPANWLRLASPEEREAIGITEEPDQNLVYDQRYYWGYDADGALIPKQLEDEPVLDQDGVATGEIQTGLKTQIIREQKQIAGSLLAGTDWYVTRKAETGVDIPSEILAYREAVRTASNVRETEISSVTSVDELVSLLSGQPTVIDPDTNESVPNPNPFITPWPQA